MKSYENWKLNAKDEIKKNSDLEIWWMKNDEAYRKQSYDEMRELFYMSDKSGDGLLDHEEIVLFVQHTNQRLIEKGLWPDD